MTSTVGTPAGQLGAERQHNTAGSSGLGRALDFAAVVYIVMQAGELYRPVSAIIGVGSQTANIFLVCFGLVYLGCRLRDLRACLRDSVFKVWCIAFLAPFPILLLHWARTTIGSDRLAYWAAFNSVTVVLFLTAGVLVYRGGQRLAFRVLSTVLLTALIGFVVNLRSPEFIRAVLVHTSNELAYGHDLTRILGFFQHPNIAALSLVMLLGGVSGNSHFHAKPAIVQGGVITLIAGGVALTGSRTSLLLLIPVLALHMVNGWALAGRTAQATARVAGSVLVFFTAAWVTVRGFASTSAPDDRLYLTLNSRIGSLSDVLTGEVSDQSLYARSEVISQYSRFIEGSPWLGYGPDFVAAQISAGKLSNVSQNAWLEWMVIGGLGLALTALIATAVTVRAAGSRANRENPGRATLLAAVVILSLATFSVVNVLSLRTPAFVLGLAVGGFVTTSRAPDRLALEDGRGVSVRTAGRV